MTSQETPRSPVRWVYLAFSLVTTAGIFGYLLTHVSVREVLDLIRQADRGAVAVFVALSLTSSALRMWRYLVLLKLWGCRPGPVAMFLVVLVRNFFSDILPARIGTLIYIFLVRTRLGVPLGAATSSFALAFLFDLIGLIAGSGILAAITVSILLTLPRLFRVAARVSSGLRLLPARWREKLAEVFENAGDDTLKAQKAGAYGPVLVLSILIRAAKYGSLFVFLYALLAPRGYTLAQMGVSRVFLGLCAAEAAASTPVSGIAGFGAYEGTWALVFELLGFPGDIAKLTSISHHLFTQVYGYSLGALALLVLLLPCFKAVGDARSAGPSGTGR
jgi:glycosyltransferase AglD